MDPLDAIIVLFVGSGEGDFAAAGNPDPSPRRYPGATSCLRATSCPFRSSLSVKNLRAEPAGALRARTATTESPAAASPTPGSGSIRASSCSFSSAIRSSNRWSTASGLDQRSHLIALGRTPPGEGDGHALLVTRADRARAVASVGVLVGGSSSRCPETTRPSSWSSIPSTVPDRWMSASSS